MLFLLSCAEEPPVAAEEPAEHAVSANPRLSVIGRAPDFRLHDLSGEAVHLSGFQGRVVLLAFVFTSCPGVCPRISGQMAKLQDGLRKEGLFGSKASLLSVTVDPATDTPAVLAKYAKTYGADPAGWKFLRETSANTRPILKAYDEWTILLPKGAVDHPARVYLIDREGNIREIYSLAFFNDVQARLDILALLRERR